MSALEWAPSNELFFKVLLRDINSDMVAAWEDGEAFGEEKYRELVEVSETRERNSLASTLTMIVVQRRLEAD